MAAKRRKVVEEDIDRGYGSTTIPTDSGGVRVASRIPPDIYLNLKGKPYFAKGDNATNDTAAVQAWINDIVSTGTPGYAPPGIYRINQVSKTMATAQSLMIVGSNGVDGTTAPKTIFKAVAALTDNNTALIDINGASLIESVVSIKNIAIDGNSLVGSGLKITNVQRRVVLENVAAKRFSTGRGFWIYGCTGLNFSGIEGSTSDVGLDIDGTTSHGEGVILGSTFQTCTTTQVKCNTGSSFLNFLGNKFYGSDAAPGAQIIDGGFALSFIGNSFESCTRSIWTAAAASVSELIATGNGFYVNASAGTVRAMDFPGSLTNSEIRHNFFDVTTVGGSTGVAVRIGTSSSNTIGPNRIAKTGGGTLIEYDPVSMGRFYSTTSPGTGVVSDWFESPNLLHLRGATSGVCNIYPQDVAGTVTLRPPNTQGPANSVPVSDASGVFSWITVAAGTYTPTLTNQSNLDGSTAYECQYSRVGNTVTVSGKVDVNPTATGTTKLGISLPIASNLGAAEDCAGTAASTGFAGESGPITGDAGNDRALLDWVTASSANHDMYFTFTYVVI